MFLCLYVSVNVCLCVIVSLCLSVCMSLYMHACIRMSRTFCWCVYGSLYVLCVRVTTCLCVHLWLSEAKLGCGSPFP